MSSKLLPVEQYAADVCEGKVTVYELVKLAVERYYADLYNALDRE